MERPDISVIIPCYNEARYIGRCLASLLNQSVAGHEIIVVDDGSTDQTVEIVESFHVRLLQQDHAGPAAARNLGASTATGKILVLVDADMFFDQDYLLHLTSLISAGEALGTFTKEEYLGNPKNRWAICWNLETVGDRQRRVPAGYPDVCPAFRAIERQSFMNVGGFETAIGYEDDTSLAPKLGFPARAARGAICYHNNPSSLREVYQSARWMGRGMRFTIHPWSVWKYVPPFSAVFAFARALQFCELHFILFKPVYDAGIFVGVFSRLIFRKHMK